MKTLLPTLFTLFPILTTLLFPAASLHADSQPSNTPSSESAKPKNLPEGVRSLEVLADQGRIHLLLGEISQNTPQPLLSHRVSTDGGVTWSEPVPINLQAPPPHGLHRGADARLAAHGNHLVAAWTTAGNDRWGSGPLATVRSSDGGKTWIPGPNPADDGRTDGHNFTALGSSPDGAFHLAWLDSRDGERGLRYSISKDGGQTWAPNATAAPKTCECCWNSLSPLSGGKIAVLYRARSPRDMHVVTSANAGALWSTPAVVGNFQWDLSVCPHVGGALTTCQTPQGERLHATVWTGASGKSGLYHLSSDDAGASWSIPHKMNVPLAWHPHLAADPHGRVAAVWDTMAAIGGEVWGALSNDAGQTWSEPRRLSPQGTPAIFPRVVPVPEGFRVFWTSELPEKPATWTSVLLQP